MCAIPQRFSCGEKRPPRTPQRNPHRRPHDDDRGFFEDTVYALFANAALAGGDAPAASPAAEEALRQTVPVREVFIKGATPLAEAALARGDLVTARRWADNVVAVVPGWYQIVRADRAGLCMAIAEGEPEQAERDAHEALVVAARTQAYTRVADTFECLARLATDDSNHQHAVRLLGVAKAARQRIGDFRPPDVIGRLRARWVCGRTGGVGAE